MPCISELDIRHARVSQPGGPIPIPGGALQGGDVCQIASIGDLRQQSRRQVGTAAILEKYLSVAHPRSRWTIGDNHVGAPPDRPRASSRGPRTPRRAPSRGCGAPACGRRSRNSRSGSRPPPRGAAPARGRRRGRRRCSSARCWPADGCGRPDAEGPRPPGSCGRRCRCQRAIRTPQRHHRLPHWRKRSQLRHRRQRLPRH